MYCNQCGTRLKEGSWTCQQCGHQLPENLRHLVNTPSPVEPNTDGQQDEPPVAAQPASSARQLTHGSGEEPAPAPPDELRDTTSAPESPGDQLGADLPATEPDESLLDSLLPASPDVPEADATTASILPEPAHKDSTRPRRQRGCGWAMMAGVLAGCALLLVLSIGGLAVYQGMQERTRLNRAAATEHYQRGLQQFSAGNYDLARAELELAMQLDPSNRDAEAKLVEVNLLESQQPTPTSAVRRQTALLLYNEARDLYNKGDWESAADRLEQVQALDSQFESDKVAELLFESYFKAGQKLVSEIRMEEAIRYFDRALTLRPSDVMIRDEKRYAALYLAGIGYWGANWQGVIDTFTALYQLRPDYLDTKQRLFEAHVEYGEYLGKKNQWCNARDQFNAALSYSVTAETVARREDAELRCATASLPTPTPAPSGVFVGRLLSVEEVGSATAMMIRGYVRDALGQPLPNISVGLSAFDWTAPPAHTNSEGLFAFDGLANPLTYTVTLLDLATVPLPVKTDWSKLVWVEFQAQP